MPRHERPTQAQSGMEVTVHLLDSKLRLLAQRIKIIENNIQVMARTIVNHNKKLKELEEKAGTGLDEDQIVSRVLEKVGHPVSAGEPVDMTKIEEDLSAIRDDLARLKAKVSQLEYIINSMNTMNFVTIDQLKEAIDKVKKS